MLWEAYLKYVEGTKSELVAFYYTRGVLREAHIKAVSELVAFYQTHVKCFGKLTLNMSRALRVSW